MKLKIRINALLVLRIVWLKMYITHMSYDSSCRVNFGIVEKNYNLEIWKLLCCGEIDHKTTSQQRFHGGNIKK